MKVKIWNKVILGFVNGMVVILPIALTVTIVRFLVVKLNEIVLDPLLGIITPFTGIINRVFLAKTLIFLVVILMVSLIGWGAKILFINRFFSFWESLLIRLPIMGRIYRSLKQISSAFIGQGKTIFKQVVLVEYPRKGIFTIGFTTGIVKGEIKNNLDAGHIAVFIPTTPNPTSGFFTLIPRQEIKFLAMSVEEGMKMVISGGYVVPDFLGKTPECETE